MGEDRTEPATPKLLDFHVYRRAIFNTPASKLYCEAAVWQGRMGSSQCSRKPTLEYGGHGWCKQHYPPNEHAREQQRDVERRAEYDAETRRWEAKATALKLREDALDALRKIAAGHNDPRGLAIAILQTGREHK